MQYFPRQRGTTSISFIRNDGGWHQHVLLLAYAPIHIVGTHQQIFFKLKISILLNFLLLT